jgi:hypothetical protein
LSSLIDLSLAVGGGGCGKEMSFPQKQKARRLVVHRRPAQLSLWRGAGGGMICSMIEAWKVGSSDFDIFLEIKYALCVFGLALKS